MVRRDTGIWVAILALCHISVSAFIHTDGWKLWGLFFWHAPGPHSLFPVRYDLFGLANYLGAAQASVLVLLLLISNNAALRRLGLRRWKALQRLSYAAAGLIALHGFAYQIVERRDPGARLIFATIIGMLLAAQGLGFLKQLKTRKDFKTFRIFKGKGVSSG
jgi:sulfoxide reductase heme-binding subunit YedZ